LLLGSKNLGNDFDGKKSKWGCTGSVGKGYLPSHTNIFDELFPALKEVVQKDH
jgi:hypothetical protein